MSLSSHLLDSSSPVRAYIDRVSPILVDAQGSSDTARIAGSALGLFRIAKSPLIVPVPQNIDTARSGTAFDIRTRIAMGGFDARTSAAGVSQLSLLADTLHNGQHRARVVSEVFAIAESLLQNSASEADLDLASIIFAQCEQIYRAWPDAMQGTFGVTCDEARDGRRFVDNIPLQDLHDLESLRKANAEQIIRWKNQIAEEVRFQPNPGFTGSSLVGGADADWLIDDSLIDCKVYGKLTVAKLRDFLRQLIGYVLLDLNDELKIRKVGIWLPRHGLMPTWSLEYLLAGDPEVLLPRLRQGFIKATGGEQLAVYQPVTQRRKHQLLADNLHTPLGMLDVLARSDDKDLRFRVGRNIATPTQAVRNLAKDKYARVRQGVAKNKRVPADLIEALSHDASVVVRRAAAANPASLRPRGHALTAGSEQSDISVGSSEINTIEPIEFNNDAGNDQQRSVRIPNERDDWVLDSRWLIDFLQTILGEDPAIFPYTLFPSSTRRWADISGRALEVPQQLFASVPQDIKDDLFRHDRPASIRRLTARNLPLESKDIRDVLLNDPDPEIRWETLRRSVDYRDEDLADLLAKLAASRDARLRFRKRNADAASMVCQYTAPELSAQTLEVIAAHQSTPPATFQDLTDTEIPEVLLALAQNPALPAAVLDTVVSRMKSTRSHEWRRMFAHSRRTPSEVLDRLSASRVLEVRVAVAENTSTPAATLNILGADRDPDVRMGVLRNHKAPESLAAVLAESLLESSFGRELEPLLRWLERRTDLELPQDVVEGALDRLSKSRLRDPDVRRTVARHSGTSEKTLRRLANSVDETLRNDVASNNRTPVNVLTQLAQDPDINVRCSVARNQRTADRALTALCQDEEWQVRRDLAGNPRLTQEAIRLLQLDKDSRVRSAAVRNPALTNNEAQSAELELRSRSETAHQTRMKLHEMVLSTRLEVRSRVAYDPKATPDVLTYFRSDRSVKVLRVLAANPNTPQNILWELADEQDLEVRQCVALNQSSPPDLLAYLAGLSTDFALLVALNPDASTDVLEALSHDDEVLVQFVSKIARADRSLSTGRQPQEYLALEENLEVNGL